MAQQVGTSKKSAAAPLEDLQAWARATEEEIEQIRQEIAPLEARMGAARERLDLIKRLIGLADRQPTTAQPRSRVPLSPVEKVVGSPATDLEAQIEAILQEVGEPMHIRVLRDRLIERGVPLPGKGEEANIIVRLRRDESKFTRTGRGMYGLATWGLPAVAPTQRKKVRRRKKSKSA